MCVSAGVFLFIKTWLNITLANFPKRCGNAHANCMDWTK